MIDRQDVFAEDMKATKLYTETSKRFRYVLGEGFTDNGKYITATEVCKLLNKMANENKELKSEIELLRQRETVQKLNAIENSTFEQFLKKQKR